MTLLRRQVRTLLALALASCAIAPASAYLKLGTMINGQTQTARWGTTPVRYFVNDQEVPGVSAEVEVWPEMIHVWHWFLPMLDEAQRAVTRIGDFVKGHLRPA